MGYSLLDKIKETIGLKKKVASKPWKYTINKSAMYQYFPCLDRVVPPADMVKCWGDLFNKKRKGTVNIDYHDGTITRTES